jgi:hypothetical protein
VTDIYLLVLFKDLHNYEISSRLHISPKPDLPFNIPAILVGSRGKRLRSKLGKITREQKLRLK